MKVIKVLGIVLLTVEILSVLTFVLSFHTMISILMTTLSNDPIQMELDFDQKGTGEMIIELIPYNQGFLDAELTLKIGALDQYGEYISQNSSKIHMSSGSYKSVFLTLKFSSDDYDRLALDSSIEVIFDLRTLNNLVGISNILRMEVQN